MVKDRRIVRFEKTIPSNLKIGRNKILEEGKIVRIDVIEQTMWKKGISFTEYKIIELRR